MSRTIQHQIALRASQIIQERGWAKWHYSSDSGVCMLGSIALATSELTGSKVRWGFFGPRMKDKSAHRVYKSIKRSAHSYVKKHFGSWDIEVWNGFSCRGKVHASSTMEKFAETL